MGIPEYALRALVTNNVHPVLRAWAGSPLDLGLDPATPRLLHKFSPREPQTSRFRPPRTNHGSIVALTA